MLLQDTQLWWWGETLCQEAVIHALLDAPVVLTVLFPLPSSPSPPSLLLSSLPLFVSLLLPLHLFPLSSFCSPSSFFPSFLSFLRLSLHPSLFLPLVYWIFNTLRWKLVESLGKRQCKVGEQSSSSLSNIPYRMCYSFSSPFSVLYSLKKVAVADCTVVKMPASHMEC